MQQVNSTIFVLLPVHNRKLITIDFVRTLKKQSYTDFKLILIDDGSTDGTAAAVMEIIPNTHVIRGDGNLWWAGSLQAGIDYLKATQIRPDSVVLMINDDTLLPENFLETGIKLINGSKEQIFCAQAYSMANGELLDSGVRIDWFKYQFIPVKSENEINCLSTRGLFVRYLDFEKIGEFKPNILPHYFSDYEFTYRAGVRGYKLRSPGELRIQMNDKTTGLQKSDGFKLREYFKGAFQIRSAINPWTGAKFIWIASPLKYKLIAYSRLFVYFAKCVIKASVNGF